jgi:hypothetical protein
MSNFYDDEDVFDADDFDDELDDFDDDDDFVDDEDVFDDDFDDEPNHGNQPKRGDLVWAYRAGYQHYGIDVGNGYVIHRTNKGIQRITLREFCNDDRWSFEPSSNREAVARRAESRLGESGYNLIFDNCEHFARWCQTGDSYSEQVNNATGVIGGIATGAAIGVGLAVLADIFLGGDKKR